MTKYLWIVFIGSVILWTACKESDKKETSSSEQKFGQYSAETFNGNVENASYFREESPFESIKLSKNKEILFQSSHTVGVYLIDAPEKIYANKDECLKEAETNATSKLTDADPKQKWNEVSEAAKKEVESKLKTVRCVLQIKGENLIPRPVDGVIEQNPKGEILHMDFDVKGIDIVQDSSLLINQPADLASVDIKKCDKTVFKNYLDKNKKLEVIKSWVTGSIVSLSYEKDLFESKRGSLNLNSLNSRELILEDTILKRK